MSKTFRRVDEFEFPSSFGFSGSSNYAKGGAACAPGGKTPRFDVGGTVDIDRSTVMPGARRAAPSTDYADEGDRRGRTFYPDEGARRGTPAPKSAPAKPAAKAPMRAPAKAPEGALSSTLAAMPSQRRDDPDRPQMQSPPVSRPAREDDVRSQRGVTTKTRQPVEITTGGGNYTDVDDYAKGGSTRAKMAALKPGIRGSTKGNMARKSAAGGVSSIPLPAAAAAARGAAMLGRASAKAPGMAPGMPTGGAPIPGPGPMMAGGPPMPGGDDAPPMMARGGHMSKAARNQGIAKVMRKADGGSIVGENPGEHDPTADGNMKRRRGADGSDSGWRPARSHSISIEEFNRDREPDTIGTLKPLSARPVLRFPPRPVLRFPPREVPTGDGWGNAAEYAKGGKVKHDDAKQDRALIKKMLAEHERGEGEGKGFAMGGRAMLPRGMKPTAMQRHSIIGEVGAAPVRSRGQGIVPRTPMPYGVAGSDERPPPKKAPTTGR